jgi:hypothetical protein
MKHRKNLGLRIKDRKERGIWAELYFIALAAGYGLKILVLLQFRPYTRSIRRTKHPRDNRARLPTKTIPVL